ncbi:MAG: EAL domain-containing protein, partial [Alphaproteobacteria bacterium]
DALLSNGDLALYTAKNNGRGTHCFFDPAMSRQVKHRHAIERDLRDALVRNQFELHYQPLVSLTDDRISSFEALLRWNHPERGQVSPDEFIPVAEEIGMIIPLGEWVLRQACAQAARWPEHIKVAVNLSPVQFRSGRIVETVVNTLASTGLSPGRLELEITEFVLLSDDKVNLEMLHRLRELGVRVAMDDFGTGYSSLSYLRAFPFDKIKIDRSFIADIAQSEDAMAIVRAVTGLGRRLGIATVAEGVETSEQRELVRALGCTQMQGYLCSPPRPAEGLAHFFADAQPQAPQSQRRAG